jgi:hypothetical protein
MLMLLACLVAAAVTTVVFLASRGRWTVLKRAKLAMVYVALTVVHCLFAIYWVWSNFPYGG